MSTEIAICELDAETMIEEKNKQIAVLVSENCALKEEVRSLKKLLMSEWQKQSVIGL